jgi:hypothetical protein
LGAFTHKTGTFIPPPIASAGLHIFAIIPVAIRDGLTAQGIKSLSRFYTSKIKRGKFIGGGV